MRQFVLIVTMTFIAGLILAGQGLAMEDYGQHMGSEMGGAMMGETHQDKMAVHSLNHDQIREMQKMLSQKGYNAGPADGVMGPMTKQALRGFQESQGLAATGNPDTATLQALAPDSETQEFFGLSPEYGEHGMQQKEMMQDQTQQPDMMQDQMPKQDMMHNGEMQKERMREHMEDSY